MVLRYYLFAHLNTDYSILTLNKKTAFQICKVVKTNFMVIY